MPFLRKKVQTPAKTKGVAMTTSFGGGSAPPRLVVLAAGEGALEPLTEVLRGLEPCSGLCCVVAQSQWSETELREALESTGHPLIWVEGRAELEGGNVYLLPPGAAAEFEDGGLRQVPSGSEDGSVDHLLQSLAQAHGCQAVAVILSGSCQQSGTGIAAVNAEGGIILVQHEGSAHFPEMPRSVISTGYADAVLTPFEIAAELTNLAHHPLAAANEPTLPGEPRCLEEVFRLLLRHTDVDFSGYKAATIRRRMLKRMLLRRVSSLEGYAEILKGEPGEVSALYQELLVDVTELFRDPELFHELREKIFPELLRGDLSEPIRFWVPGCSRGDEAYSLAITFLEVLRERDQVATLQVFATDIDETALTVARRGCYPAAALDRLPEEYRRYFTTADQGYQISKSVRDLCLFARQDVTRDPPFPNLDLISCRNLLIYLGPALQRRVLESLHYALKPDGVLLLGQSESTSCRENLFNSLSRKLSIFRRQGTSSPPLPDYRPSLRSRLAVAHPRVRQRQHHDETFEVQKQADRLILARYSPAGVIVDENHEVVQFRGRTGQFLEPPVGSASHCIFKMAREGLLAPLREAVNQAQNEGLKVSRRGVRVLSNGGYHEFDLEVMPIRLFGTRSPYLLILFDDKEGLAAGSPAPYSTADSAKEVTDLREELLATREYLSSIIQERESTNEELKAANEEVQSSNEELQSANEELETAKEELQSTNEELATINEELHDRNQELQLANADLHNILDSVNFSVLILDSQQRVRRFTPTANALLNLIPGDVDRPFNQVRTDLELPDFESQVQEVLSTLVPVRFERQNSQGRWFAVSIRPYRTGDGRIDGVVVTFSDIDEERRAHSRAEQYQTMVQELADMVTTPLLVVDEHLEVLQSNRAFHREFAEDSPLERSGWSLCDWSAADPLLPAIEQLLADPEQKGLQLEFGPHQDRDYRVDVRARRGAEPTVLMTLERREVAARGGTDLSN